MKDTKKGITVTFKEEPNSIAGLLTAYIKQNPGETGTDKDQQNLVNQILLKSGLSQNTWKVVRIKLTPNSWGVTMKDDKGKKTEVLQASNYQLKVEIYLERMDKDMDVLESYMDLIKEMPSFVLPKRSIVKAPLANGIAAEMALYDAHFGKLAWKDETGYRHYDTKLAAKDYAYAADRCLDLIAPHNPEKIFYVVGNDLYHIDNMSSHTTTGDHTLDVDGRITKVHKIVFVNVRDAIVKASVIAPVEVIWVPGNHDYLASYMLVFALKEHFKDYPRVTVDINENPRKARLWGNLLVGWTHRIVGKHTVWSNELAQAFPELWGKSMFREWHHGDQHKKLDVKITPIFTSGGVICRQVTALSPVDQWHTTNVFTDAVPGGEAFMWSKETGVFANYIAWTGQYEQNRTKIVIPKCSTM
jgi:hypothetical protein